MTPEEYLRIPYLLEIRSVPGPEGVWLRRAEHPELPGCAVEAFDPLEALDRLDEARVRFIRERLTRGEPVPVPRPPLHPGFPVAGLGVAARGSGGESC